MKNRRQHIQGARWRRLDNTAKVFPGITNEDLSNVFRVSAVLKERVEPELLEQALARTLEDLEGFRVKLRRGFFWYYFETNRRRARVEKENTYPCRFIDPHSSQLFLFRVSYYERRINLEVFHALTDGLGGMDFLRRLTREYIRLKRGRERGPDSEPAPSVREIHDVEDSYKRNYKKARRKKYATCEAFQLSGEYISLDACSVIHGTADACRVKAAAASFGVSVTKYLTALLLWSILEEFDTREQPVGVNLPVNLRNIFDSGTGANFFAVTLITCRRKQASSFESLVREVSRQMDENLKRERLEETIAYNVSNERNLLVRLVPLPIKGIGVRAVFARSSRAYTVTLSNLGVFDPGEGLKEEVAGAQAMIGVSRQQPLKCVVVTCEGQMVITFSSVFRQTGVQRRFFECMERQEIPVRLESNGVPEGEIPRGMYPQIPYDGKKLPRVLLTLYLAMGGIAGALTLLNWATYQRSGVWWSLIVAACMAYVLVTVRYSIVKNTNLAFKLVVQSVGIQALLVVLDWVTGYRGWSVNYAIPGVILFDVTAIAGLMVFNRLNWQSYFMYQIALTLFGFMPLFMFWIGWISRPHLAVITMAVSVLLLICTVCLGDRSVKNELIRRFHI